MSLGTAIDAGAVRQGTWLRVLALVAICLVAFLPGISTLPPTDRDESRYVQASKQMVETGDYVDIRLQDVSRYKKPIGIYWLQSAYVTVSGQGPEAPLWVYRLVSTTGGLAAVLLVFVAGRRFFGEEAGFLAAVGTAGMFALQFEARIAKTDAVLLATCVGAQAALGFVYLAHKRGEATGRWLPWLFWIAQGLAVLVKGPIGPLLSVLTIAFVAWFDKDRSWLRKLRPLPGLGIVALIALPWLALITWKSGAEFWRESVGNDLLGKTVESQESHGAPPGYYVLTWSLFMWPFATLALEGGLRALNRMRTDPRMLFLVAWYVPFWLVYEIFPTKLPHYVLPAYPAMLLAMAWALTDPQARTAELARWQRWLLLAAKAGLILVTVGLAAASAGAVPALMGDVSIAGLVAAPLFLAAGWLALKGLGGVDAGRRVVAAAVGGALAVGLFAHAVVPALTTVWLSPRTAQAFVEHRPCETSVLSSANYHEPSLVFLAGTQTRLVNGREAAEDLLADPACAIAVIAGAEMDRFTQALPQGLGDVTEVARIEGINYSKGDTLVLRMFTARKTAE